MNQQARNKIALGLFFLLFALGGFLLLLYVYLGHNWNYAATEIDEVSGSMEEYLVVMFDGTTDPMLVASQKASGEGMPGFRQGDVSLGSEELDRMLTAMLDAKYGPVVKEIDEGSPPAAEASGRGETGVPGEADSAGESMGGVGTSGGSGMPGEADSADDAFASNAEASEANSSSAAPQDANGTPAKKDEPKRDLGNAYASYIGKNADVLPLFTKDPEVFTEGVIYLMGSYKVGVLGLERPVETSCLQERIDKLRADGANVVFLIATNKNFVLGTTGVDIVIQTQGSTGDLMGYRFDNTYVVEASAIGTIDAVIMSPNHVMTVKRITRF